VSSKKLVLEIDEATEYAGKPLRASLSVLDEDGSGHGHRLFGPKFSGMPGKTLKSYVLGGRDRQSLRDLLGEVDGPPTISDEAIEAAAKAMAAYAVNFDPEEDPDQFMTWDEMDEDDREKIRGAARATIEAALPLLKYEVQ
jgi:hypothetical protein